jgi:SNF2 family DNA or RNA helicase
MKAKPYNFQIVGINFLTEKKKCLLGDTMGLGKTVQILGAIYKLQYENKSNRALIIAPTSLKYQWVDEINKFLKDPVYIIIDKEPKKRQQSYELIEKENINIVVTSYELARIDIDYLLKINWNIIVLDECHKIKTIRLFFIKI